MARKLTTVLSDANRREMDYAILVGKRELKEESVVIQNRKKREQKTVKINKLVEKIKKQGKPNPPPSHLVKYTDTSGFLSTNTGTFLF